MHHPFIKRVIESQLIEKITHFLEYNQPLCSSQIQVNELFDKSKHLHENHCDTTIQFTNETNNHLVQSNSNYEIETSFTNGRNSFQITVTCDDDNMAKKVEDDTKVMETVEHESERKEIKNCHRAFDKKSLSLDTSNKDSLSNKENTRSYR